MTSRVEFELVVSLDYVLETKMGPVGPFTPNENTLVILMPFIATFVVYMMAGAWCLVALIVVGYGFPKFLMTIKANKPKSWMWDYIHASYFLYYFGLISNKRHMGRPFAVRTFTGARRLVAGVFTNARAGCLTMTKNVDLIYGLPEICEFDIKTEKLKPSITPIVVVYDEVYIVDHVFMPNGQKYPKSFDKAIQRDNTDSPILHWKTVATKSHG